MEIKETVSQNRPLLSLQELKEKTKERKYDIAEMLDKGSYYPADANITEGLGPEDKCLVATSIRNIPLKEFLQKSATAGANYLVAAKVHDEIVFGSRLGDRVPFLSAYVVNGWEGADLDVCIAGVGAHGWSYIPKRLASGGIMPTETVNVTKATCTMLSFGYNIEITEDLVEDAVGNADLIEYHLQHAGQEMGVMATREAVKVLVANADGVGTVNALTGDAAETKWSGSDAKDIVSAQAECIADGFYAQTVITQYESWHHSINASLAGNVHMPPKTGFDDCINNVDIYAHTYAADLTTATPKLQTVVYDRNNALLTARKRWLKIEKYSEPIRSLSNAVITARQDSVTLYKDATCVITEA